MAITATHYELFKSLPLPRGGSLLEIGEANWYGDLDPQSVGLESSESLFEIAKKFYAATFAPSCLVAIDNNGTPDAMRHDLNTSLTLDQQFDVIINHGTAEHVFNIAQVFLTMHDACEVGGLMVHDAPFTGWIDHGFYCIHPTLFYDLSTANCYEVVKMAIHEIKSRQIIALNGRDSMAKVAGTVPNNSMLFVALRKLVDIPFRVPMQGVYARTLSEAGRKAWEEFR